MDAQLLAEELVADLLDDPTQPGAPVENLLRSFLVDAPKLAQQPPPPPLVEGFLYQDSLAWLQGKPGVGKSFIALDLAGCVAAGVPWHGRNVTAGQVVYVLAEGAAAFGPRIRAWSSANGPSMDGVKVLPCAVNLGDAFHLRDLREILSEITPALVVIDTQAKVTPGSDENSARDMGRLVSALESLRLAASGACILTLHHEPRHADNLRGSTALEGAATTIIRATRNASRVQLSCKKQKDAEPFDDLNLSLRSYEESAAFVAIEGKPTVHSLTPSESKLLGFLGQCPENSIQPRQEILRGAGIKSASYDRARRACSERVS